MSQQGPPEENPFTSPSGPAAQAPGPAYGPPPAQEPSYQQYQPPPYGPPPPTAYGYGGPVLPDHPQAQTAFVVGLVSLVGGFFCGIPIFVGPWAWIVGARARKEIDAAPGQYAGREKATAGMVMGIIATALLALLILVIAVAVFVIIVAAA